MSGTGQAAEREPDPVFLEEWKEDTFGVGSPAPDHPDDWLWRWAAANVDYLTDVCLGPVTREILAGWDEGGTEPPWKDAGPSAAAEKEKDQKGEAA